MGCEKILCPHCSVGTTAEFREAISSTYYKAGGPGGGGPSYRMDHGYCQNPECERLIIRLEKIPGDGPVASSYVVPRAIARVKIDGIPPELADDYEQACAVLDASPAASAALARRCLQGLIRNHFKIKGERLYDEIKEVAGLKTLPPYLAEGLDRIREIGNLASHPTHDAELGVIVNVEREEAEWTLEILESLFKHCYVDPKEYEWRTQKLREKLDKARGPKGGQGQAGKAGQEA